MICELIQTTTLNDGFHSIIEKLNGINPASVVQNSKQPRSKIAYPLAYYQAFAGGDTNDIKALLGLIHFGMLCIGQELDISEVLGWPHGLRCLQGTINRRGFVGVVMTGNGEHWSTAIQNAGRGTNVVQEWGVGCYYQFAKYNLSDLMGTMQKKSGGYFLN